MSLRASRVRPVLLALTPLTLALAGSLACTEAEPVADDPEQVLAAAIDLAALERLDLEPVETLHNMKMGYAEIYANEAAAELFRALDGGDPNATAVFPRGSLLVKRHLDDNLEPTGVLTVLAKFDEGYHPEGNDWFFALINADGEVLDEVVGNGAKVVFCVDCHQQMGANTDGVIPLLPSQLR
jgi:hypothetical protein